VKYIPLNPADPNSYLSFGGEIRERYEHYTNPGFGIPPQPNDNDYLLQRITLSADLHLNKSGICAGFRPAIRRRGTGAPVQQDRSTSRPSHFKFDLSQRLPLRGGRFEMTYGSGRLVATRAPGRHPFKFDGLQIIDAVAAEEMGCD
jgi:hypothetical protein